MGLCKGSIDITDFGAKGDGITVNTESINNAVKALGKGETLIIPEGVFITGAVFLKSDMTLYLSEGAVLKGSDDLRDFPVVTAQFEGAYKDCYASLINVLGEGYSNIVITGEGTISGNGAVLGPKELSENSGARGRTIYIEHIDGLTVTDVTIRESPSWCFHIFDSKNISIEGIKLYNKYREDGEPIALANGDGIDPDCCSNVRIINCFIESEDDCIAIKSGRDETGRRYGVPSEDILVKGCRFSGGFGVACGSEMSGGVRRVRVEDCTFKDTFSIASVKNCRGRGSVIEDVIYENCRLINNDKTITDSQWFRGALYIDQYYGIPDKEIDLVTPHDVDDGTPEIRNIVFKDITLKTVGGNSIYICGLPENHVKDITLENITATGKKGIIINNADDVKIKGLTVSVLDK